MTLGGVAPWALLAAAVGALWWSARSLLATAATPQSACERAWVLSSGVVGVGAVITVSLLLAAGAVLGLALDGRRRLWYVVALLIAHSAWVGAVLRMFLLASYALLDLG